MNIKRIISTTILMGALFLAGCGSQSLTFNEVFEVTNNARITVYDVDQSELIEKLELENQFSGVIFMGQEDDLSSEIIAYELTEERNEAFDSIYFLNTSNEDNDELVELLLQIGGTVHWDEEGNQFLPNAEVLIVNYGFVAARLSDFALDDNFEAIDNDRIEDGMQQIIEIAEIIFTFNDPADFFEGPEFEEFLEGLESEDDEETTE